MVVWAYGRPPIRLYDLTTIRLAFSAVPTLGGNCAMRMLVLGAGLQGSACAYDLLQHADVERVTIADLRTDRLPPFLRAVRGKRLAAVKLNVKDARALKKRMAGHDAVLCALPYYFNHSVARTAVAAGLHHADLGGNTDIVVEQKRKLHRAAVKKGVSVIPDCGLAPGMINVLAAQGPARGVPHGRRHLHAAVGLPGQGPHDGVQDAAVPGPRAHHARRPRPGPRSEEHTSELQSPCNLV